MSNSSNPSSPASNAYFAVIVPLSFGIGIPFARFAAPHIWPGLDEAWGGRTVNAVSTLVACGIVSLLLWGAVKLFRKRDRGGLGQQTPTSA